MIPSSLPCMVTKMIFRYDWQAAFYTGWHGRHYVAKVSDVMTLDVFRRDEGNTWEWVVIGYDLSLPDQRLIIRHGTAGTMKEAKQRAELQIGNPQQTLFHADEHRPDMPWEQEVPF